MGERITGQTELIGLIAYPIRHSNSPRMHNEAFAKLGLDYAYIAFEVDNDTLEDTIKGFKAMKVRGWNVSMPNKTVVHKYLDHLAPAAKICGAVNTVVNDNGVLTGHITDGIGFMMALKDANIDVIDRKITIVGAGGAGTAIAVQAALDGVMEISIFNHRDDYWVRAKNIVNTINEQTGCIATLHDLADLDDLKSEMASSFLFINATGIGMKPLEGQTYIPDKSYFHKELNVADVIYAPEQTAMLKMAQEAGCKTMNGSGMMLYQGAAAFKLWTGHDMPIDYIKEVMDIRF